MNNCEGSVGEDDRGQVLSESAKGQAVFIV